MAVSGLVAAGHVRAGEGVGWFERRGNDLERADDDHRPLDNLACHHLH